MHLYFIFTPLRIEGREWVIPPNDLFMKRCYELPFKWSHFNVYI